MRRYEPLNSNVGAKKRKRKNGAGVVDDVLYPLHKLEFDVK